MQAPLAAPALCSILLVMGACRRGDSSTVALPGRVSGLVYTDIGEDRFPIPGATVRFEKAPADVGSVQANREGRFVAFFMIDKPSPVRACAVADGFLETCVDVDIEPEDGTLAEIALAPEGTMLFGTVLDADGVSCNYDNPALQTSFATSVTIDDAIVVPVDSRGRYVFGGASVGDHSIRAVCERSNASATATVTGTAGPQGAFALQFDNHAPVIQSVVARDADGRVVRYPSPGQILTVTVSANDPDGDSLDFRWLTDGELRGERGSSIAWQLHDVQANNMLLVQVTDGKGGAVTSDLWLSTGQGGARVAGALVDEAGDPLADVHVSINEIDVSSDDNGRFRAVVPEADRYLVTAYAPGRAIISRVFDSEVTGLVMTMPPARTYPVDPAQGIQIDDRSSGIHLEIGAGMLVDDQGQPAPGPLTLSLHPYTQTANDPEPGDQTGLDSDGQQVGVQVLAAISVLFTDEAGKRYQLQPGARVSVGLSEPLLVEPDPCDDPPPSPPQMAHYAETQGQWVVSTNPLLPGTGGSTWDSVTMQVGGLAVVSIFERTCIRVQADRGSIVVPLEASFAEFTGCREINGDPIYEHVRDVTISDYEPHIITNLKANAYYDLVVFPTGTTGALYYSGRPRFHKILAPGPNPLAGGYPFEQCEDRPELLRRYASDISLKAGKYMPSDGTGYYQSIGAFDTRPTLGAWLSANGFSTDDGVTARFYNAAELGIGREVTCRKDGKRLACYIVKYGEPGGPVAKALDDLVHRTNPGDTVAIDTNGDGSRLRFYVYGPDGILKTHTKFAPGSEWDAPGACYGCHWVNVKYGVYGVLASVDPNTHIYAEELPYETQAENIRRINAMVRSMTKVTTKATREYIDLLYPQGVDTLGAVAADAVFPAWQESSQTENAYRWTMRSHCQVCHIGVVSLATAPAHDQASAVCGYASTSLDDSSGYWMPGSWVSHRNLWQGFSKAGILTLVTSFTGKCELLADPEVDEEPP